MEVGDVGYDLVQAISPLVLFFLQTSSSQVCRHGIARLPCRLLQLLRHLSKTACLNHASFAHCAGPGQPAVGLLQDARAAGARHHAHHRGDVRAAGVRPGRV